MVSWVVKVLEATMNSVVSGSRPLDRLGIRWVPSTLETKCGRGLGLIGLVSAAQTIFGPRLEPPMPILTTSVMGLPVKPFQSPARTRSVKASHARSTALTSGITSAPSTRIGRLARLRSATCSTAPQKSIDELVGDIGADDTAAEHQHVHVVVLDALMRRVGVVANASADPRQLVDRDTGANAATANHDAAVGLAFDHGEADFFGVVGIIDGFGPVRSDIDRLVLAVGQMANQLLFELHTGMVGSHYDAHGLSFSARLSI
jgi:hypothetical protein